MRNTTLLCCVVLVLAGNAHAIGSAAYGASQPPIGASNPDKTKAEHAAREASEAKPLTSTPKSALAPPQADRNKGQAANGEKGGKLPGGYFSSLLDSWAEKFRDDPIVSFTLVLALFTCILAFDTKGLRRSTKLAAEAALAAVELAKVNHIDARRAWLKITSIEFKGPIKFGASQIHVSVSVALENIGQTPALHIEPMLLAIVIPHDKSGHDAKKIDARASLATLDTWITARDNAPKHGWEFVFPGDKLIREIGTQHGASEFPGTTDLTIDVLIAIKYWVAGDADKPRHTGIKRTLFRADATCRFRHIRQEDGDIPVVDLFILNSGDYAD